ncbi:EAL domain-containing protein [Pontibacter sp. JAM-7]|uniref:EAL domain-containing protein n=1 Tax=Pontibacter sp. JAM-7 TaxID=3366581 RepID=UPI003AF7ADD1
MLTALFEAKQKLEQFSTNARRSQRLNKDIQVLFVGISTEHSARILNLLRSVRMSPRGRDVADLSSLTAALSERSWDLLLIDESTAEISLDELHNALQERNRDIPVIKLVDSMHPDILDTALQQQPDCIIPQDNDSLALHLIQRELQHLHNRKQLRKAQADLSDCEENIRQLINESSQPILLCREGRISSTNASLLDFLGYLEPQELENENFSSLISKGNRREFSTLLRNFENSDSFEYCINLPVERADKSELNCRIVLKKLRLQDQLTLQATLHAKNIVTENILHEGIDYLSGLYNQSYLSKELGYVIHKALDGGHDCHLLYLCLDNYQAVEQQHGEEATEQMIRTVAQLLQKMINRVHLIARPDNDTFALIFFDSSTDKAMQLAKKLRREIRRCEVEFGDTTLNTSCSVSVSPINDNAPGKEEALQQAADMARQLSSSEKGDAIGLVTPRLEKHNQDNSSLTDKLWILVRENSLQLMFQPIVEMNSNPSGVEYYEVLLRFIDGRNKSLSPSGLMQRINDPELKVAIDRWVIEQSLTALKHSGSKNQQRLAISLSHKTMVHPETLVWLAERLREHQLSANSLIFQISETDIGLDIQSIRQFTQELANMSCQVCIKHFGSAPNSREILKRVKSHYVKLDGSYIRDLQENNSFDTSFKDTVDKLRAQEKKVIAPMVEDTQVMCKLWKAGVDFIQGFYLQPPKTTMDYDFFEQG